jgi:DNA polymerase-1
MCGEPHRGESLRSAGAGDSSSCSPVCVSPAPLSTDWVDKRERFRVRAEFSTVAAFTTMVRTAHRVDIYLHYPLPRGRVLEIKITELSGGVNEAIMTTNDMKTLLLIDANSIIHRSFHALPPFTAPGGQPSGALYGLASILLKLWREERPDYAAALFDRPEPTFRDKKYAAYKAQRPPAADELVSQIIEARHLFEAFGIKTFEKPGFEADDLIATLATRFKNEKDLQIVILTGDRDTLQLVEGEKVVVRTFNKGVSDTTTYDEKAVIEKYGLAPVQLIDYKALVGDASDNIKGVPGVGPKTATELMQKFGSVENIYNHLADDPKLEKKFGPFRKEAELSRELVTLEKNAPITLPALDALAPPQEAQALNAYFERMGFSTLLKRLNGKEESAKKPKSVQGTIW